MSLDVMKQALEALEEVVYWYQCRDKNDNPMPVRYQNPEIKKSIEAITFLRDAIEQAQEPVAWMHNLIEGNVITHRPADIDRHPERWAALYTAPPPCPTCEALARSVMMDQTSHDMAPRQWQGLTDEDVDEVERWIEFKEDGSGRIPNQKLVRYIERKLREKNT